MFAPLIRLHTELWRNCVVDTAEVFWVPPCDAEVNTLGFLALHLVEARYYTVGLLGGTLVNPFAERTRAARTQAELTFRPGLEELAPAWDEGSTALLAAVEGASEGMWEEPLESPFPIDDPSRRGGMGFLLHHEAYHLGQMGYLRRCFGLPAMAYPGR